MIISNTKKFINLQKVTFFILTLFFFASLNVFAGSNNNDNNVLKDTLSNGLRVVIVKNPLAPVVTTEINYLVGSNEAPEGFPGTAHALEHMMFRGSKGLSADQLADITASMGGDFNADTRQNVTQYFFTVPSEDLDLALHIESIRMKGILATDSLWQNERGAIEQEVAQDNSNPQYIIYAKLLKAMFKGTPYEHDALGTKASFDKTTGAMLQQFHNTWYAPNNAVLVIAGDVNLHNTLSKVKKYFGDIPRKKLPVKPAITLQNVETDTLKSPTDLPYGLVFETFRMPGTESPDYYSAQILSDVLSSQRGELYSLLVPTGKALYAGFQYSALPKSGLGFAFAVYPKGSDAKTLIKEMNKIISNQVKKGFSQDLVEAEKRQELTSAEFQKNSISGLADDWSEAVAVDGKESPDNELNELEKVTLKDVNNAALKYLDDNHVIYAILNPESSGKPITKNSFGGKESFAPKNPKEVKLPGWAKSAIEKLNVPESVVSPVVYNLKNGIKLIVQKETLSNTVSVYGHIKNNSDLEEPKNEEGVSSVLGQLFEFGSNNLNRIQFQKALDDIGADESAGTSFSLNVLSNHFERGIQLLADNELNPALPENAFKIIRQRTSAEVAGELKSPDYLSGRTLLEGLYPKDDPTLRQTTPATLDSLTIQSVKNYYKKVYRPDLTTIVVIGNIEPEKVKNTIENYLGSWHAEGNKPDVELLSVPENKPSVSNVPDKSRIQDEVNLAQTLGLTRSDSDYYALQLGNHVLGGSFYATRLYKDLRENSGLVYYVSSSFNIGKTRSTYNVNYGCDPTNVNKAKSIVVRDLKIMQDSLVTKNELQRAKAMLLREIPLSESSLRSIAHGLLSRAVNDLPLNEPFIAAKKYLNLSAAQIKDAFAKWIRPEGFVEVTQGPNPQ